MEKKCKPLCKGLWIGGTIALLALLTSKKDCRERVVTEIKKASKCTEEAFTFVRDNREQIIDQIRTAVGDVSTVVKEVSDDIKQLSETATQLKDSSEEVVQVTKDAASEIKKLK